MTSVIYFFFLTDKFQLKRNHCCLYTSLCCNKWKMPKTYTRNIPTLIQCIHIIHYIPIRYLSIYKPTCIIITLFIELTMTMGSYGIQLRYNSKQ